MFKKVFWQGRNERRGEAYCCMYVEHRSEVRTQPEAFFNIRRKGATGFDGDTDTTVACRALRVSYNSGKMQLPIKNWHSQLNSS